ncbi:hypothetical protein ACNJUT_21510, partial [Mycobacterium tuberculosis]
AFDRLHGLRERACGLIDANRAAYRELLADHPALDQHLFDQGTTVFPRLRHEDGDSLFARLVRDFDTSVVPGRFFGAPDHIRIGLAGDPKTSREGMRRLAAALRA